MEKHSLDTLFPPALQATYYQNQSYYGPDCRYSRSVDYGYNMPKNYQCSPDDKGYLWSQEYTPTTPLTPTVFFNKFQFPEVRKQPDGLPDDKISVTKISSTNG